MKRIQIHAPIMLNGSILYREFQNLTLKITSRTSTSVSKSNQNQSTITNEFTRLLERRWLPVWGLHLNNLSSTSTSTSYTRNIQASASHIHAQQARLLSLSTSESNQNAKGKYNNNNASNCSSGWILASALFTGLTGFLWHTGNSSVEAAKPFNDADYNEGGGGPGRIFGGGGGRTNVPERKQSNRERYNFIAEVVDSVVDAVVCIEVKDHARIDFFTGVPHTASNGSGFIVREDGLILTNAHVVAAKPRSSFTVRLTDGRTFSAVVEEIDYDSDLATIRINAKNLPTLPLGCSSENKIGEWVVAVGAPLALSNTITAGVISSVNRGASELGLPNGINYIQTDAAITFGNSGGPLINLDGEAIGINSMKVAAGISFAIPIDHAKKFLAKADCRRKSGVKMPSRRYMGITILTVNEQIRRELEVKGGYAKVSDGALVWQVVVGSPAYLAGIKPGDIITRINGVGIKSSADIYEAAKTADTLQIHVQRADKLYACTVTPELVNEE